MQANIQALQRFKKCEDNTAMIGLLEGIKSLIFNFEFEVTKHIPYASLVLSLTLKNFYKFYQPKTMGDEEFLKKYTV